MIVTELSCSEATCLSQLLVSQLISKFPELGLATVYLQWSNNGNVLQFTSAFIVFQRQPRGPLLSRGSTFPSPVDLSGHLEQCASEQMVITRSKVTYDVQKHTACLGCVSTIIGCVPTGIESQVSLCMKYTPVHTLQNTRDKSVLI